MKRINIIILTLFFCIGITGCEDKTSVEWYVNHHKEMISKYTECLLAKSWDDVTCQNARSAVNLEADKPDVRNGVIEARRQVMDRAMKGGDL
ncbi:EexN family lipoprotein [Salmonella enterica subsp. enterica]|uniref:Entry exclusion protein n=1 Tax=Salmonella diarizonae TaxID=59204 RepID=A0A702DBP1_SALDZ|nr:entry exclusion protein [Salmonella enterica]EDQ3844465.1 EexN family lipoprotein [Salmonella enterica subsp. enterica serovar Bareilly]EKR1798959.1 EexN family lipoprotein [Salmonella enterica subsp. diarizonae serovar 65:z10:e,n,x,z15]HAC6767587.1 entry exclusion protein [Salmonella enterica subsp. diarizonae]HCM6306891.1 EexN family lipoprotein [Salmonella enterica subsp. enterica serovar 6,14:y:1,7]